MLNVNIIFHNCAAYSIFAFTELANDCQSIYNFKIMNFQKKINFSPKNISKRDMVKFFDELNESIKINPEDIYVIYFRTEPTEDYSDDSMIIKAENESPPSIFISINTIIKGIKKVKFGLTEEDALSFMMLGYLSKLTLPVEVHTKSYKCILRLCESAPSNISMDDLTFCPDCRREFQASHNFQGLGKISDNWREYISERNRQISDKKINELSKTEVASLIHELSTENQNDINKLIDITLKSIYPSCKRLALKNINPDELGDNDLECLVKALEDQHQSVRLEALDTFKPSWAPVVERGIAARYLLDKREMVRKRAKKILNTYKSYSSLKNIKEYSEDILENHYIDVSIRGRAVNLIEEVEYKLETADFIPYGITIIENGKGKHSYRIKLYRWPLFLGDLDDVAEDITFTNDEWANLEKDADDLDEITETGRFAEMDPDDLDSILTRIGGYLYKKLFEGEIGKYYHVCRQIIDYTRDYHGIHLILYGLPQELRCLPWNLLYEEETQKFLAKKGRIIPSHYINIPGQNFRTFSGSRDINILAILSEPTPEDLQKLQAETGIKLDVVDTEEENINLRDEINEWQKYSDALIDIDIVNGDVEEIRKKMRDRSYDYDAIHYFGHGFFWGEEQSGLVFEPGDKTSGESEIAPKMLRFSDDICTLFEDNQNLQIVVLNCCHGAAMSKSQPFKGLGENLLRSGIPCVIGMRYAIRKRTALRFTRSFYRELARTRSVKIAFSMAQKEIALAQPIKQDFREWAAPVLFMRKRPVF